MFVEGVRVAVVAFAREEEVAEFTPPAALATEDEAPMAVLVFFDKNPRRPFF